jgi:hypothetical protein
VKHAPSQTGGVPGLEALRIDHCKYPDEKKDRKSDLLNARFQARLIHIDDIAW